MTGREAILAAVRRANATAADEAVEASSAYRRTGSLLQAERETRFVERLTAYGVQVACVSTEAEVAVAITDRLAAVGASRVAAPADLPDVWRSSSLTWLDAGALDAAELDAVPVVVTGCALAIAETGTLVLDGGVAQGRRALTLTPDHHVCVVRADQLVETLPDALQRLVAMGASTRPLTFISGPSATADIEFDRVAGVHGPRRLDVVLL